MSEPVRLGVIGIDHRHIYEMIGYLCDAGAELGPWYTEGAPGTLDGFLRRFPGVTRVATEAQVLNDPTVSLILTAGIPSDRAGIACRAMDAGKDVLTDKPGCLTFDDLARLRDTQGRTGRIWSVCFSERLKVPGMTLAAQMLRAGEIGTLVQTLGLGPHRLNVASRPDWFWDKSRNGGILADIGTHQIDQFLFLTGVETAQIVHASVQCTQRRGFEDFGQMTLRAGQTHGYVRLDWFTPDALPTWGDGRYFLLGTQGTIELRKYVDVGGAPGTDHLLIVNGTRCEKLQAADAGLPFFAALLDDVRQRTQSAMPQAHSFRVTQLALEAQAMAEAAC